MHAISDDVIDHLAGILPEDPLSSIRQVRAIAREQAQLSFTNLFSAEAAAGSPFTQETRLLVAVFVAKLHREEGIASFYAGLLEGRAQAQLAVVASQADQSLSEGPYGHYPAGPLSNEDQPGPSYVPDGEVIPVLGAQLTAALVHSHMLVFHPRDASQAALQQLLDAGWQTPAVVTLSQLVSFLSYQIRVVTGLRLLAQVNTTTSAQ